jgi:AcrR family transcriptional regulator
VGLNTQVNKATHPTKTKLIETAMSFIKKMPHDEISVDMILKESNISKGSMYHHFVDLSDLLDTAMIEQYAKLVDATISMMTEVLTSAKSNQEIYDGLVRVTELTQSPTINFARMQRVQAIAKSHGNEKMTQIIQREQQRLTAALSDLIIDCQEKGFVNSEIDPKALSVFIQAYTIGKVIDDISGDPTDQQGWNSLINLITKKVVTLN